MSATGTDVPPGPTAVRLRRPGWRDPRLLGGLVLVALSVALGSGVVAAAGRTVPVLAAREALVPGEVVEGGALVVREVRMDDADLYLQPGAALADGGTVVRAVGAGELVPVAAVAAGADLELRAVAIQPAGTLSRDVVEGALVDLWLVPPADEAAAPSALAEGLTVAEVAREQGGLAVGSGPTVHVLVPQARLAAVLEALAGEGTVEIVAVPGGSGA